MKKLVAQATRFLKFNVVVQLQQQRPTKVHSKGSITKAGYLLRIQLFIEETFLGSEKINWTTAKNEKLSANPNRNSKRPENKAEHDLEGKTEKFSNESF